MQTCHHLGALALLGALILYFILWPICCCAAKPTWSPSVAHVADYNMKLPANLLRKNDNSTLSNQTYHDLLTSAENTESLSTNNISDSSNALIGNVSRADNRGVVKVNQLQSTTSIYELFELHKREYASSNQKLSRTDRSVHLNSSNSKNNSVSGSKRVKNNNNKKAKLSTLERNERSANLSHITGSARKIQLYIKNRFLQLLPDGTVNGTTDDLSEYSKLDFEIRFCLSDFVVCLMMQMEFRDVAKRFEN